MAYSALIMAPKIQHGGRRKGAGRPQLGPEPRRRRNITLTESEMRRARYLGDGNASLGISRALETCPNLSPHTKAASAGARSHLCP